MNRPGLLTRFAGSPRGALLLFVLYGAVGYCWWWGWQGWHVRWWVALGAVGAAFRTLGAIGRMRRYNAWLAEWRAMGGNDAPPRPEKRRRGWLLTAGAALLVAVIPAYLLPWIRNNDIPNREALARALALLWCLACLILVWKLSRLVWLVVRRSASRTAARRREKAEAAPVAWLLDRASSSPSRADAEGNLPEHFKVQRVPAIPGNRN